MLIDWFTVTAQLLNFLILVWLLKRFLYRPILDAIDAREQRIAAELADADAKKAEALQERTEFQNKNAAFEAQRSELLEQATTAAHSERQRLLDEARQAAVALSAKRMQALNTDAEQLDQALRSRVQAEVFAIARKTLADLATVDLEVRMVEVFSHRLHTMDGEARNNFAHALNTASEPVRVRSTFDLPETARVALQNALNETFSATLPAPVSVRFETAPDQVGGIELSVNGQKLAWNIADYLTTLELGVAALLKVPTAAQPVQASQAAQPAAQETTPHDA